MSETIESIGGVSLETLAKTYSTPLYIYDQKRMEDQMDAFRDAFETDDFSTSVLYASKAFSCLAMIALVKEHGLSLDVVSSGELYTAYKAGFPMERVYFHGNNKTLEELKMAFEFGVKTIIMDNEMECDAILALANALQKEIQVMLRVNPGVEAHTHKYIVTAHIDSKFGITIHEQETIARMLKKVEKNNYVTFLGFHAHIGSQIFDSNAYVAEIETMCNFIKEMKDKYQITTKALNLGGGFAAYYTKEDHPIPIQEVCDNILKTCKKMKQDLQLDIDTLMIEPGRSIVAEAGSTLYRVGYSKDTKNKHYVFVDGGMSDNIRPALYQAKYDCDLVNNPNEKTIETCVAGKCCESGDIIIENILLPQAHEGDLLIVYTTGAYGYSMASNYNRLTKPAVVFVKDGQTKLVIKKETYEDLIALDCLD